MQDWRHIMRIHSVLTDEWQTFCFAKESREYGVMYGIADMRLHEEDRTLVNIRRNMDVVPYTDEIRGHVVLYKIKKKYDYFSVLTTEISRINQIARFR